MTIDTLEPDGLYPMRVVVQLTDLNAETIRAWQRRYGAIKPRRSEGNARRFTMEDIRRLSLLKKATSAGQAISEIAQLSETELLKIIESSQQHATTERVRDDQLDNIFQGTVVRFLEAVARYDTGEATKVLSSAALYLETRSFLLEIVIPLMNKIGQDWHSGAMRIGQEHFATEILKGVLFSQRTTTGSRPGGMPVVTCAPDGCLHEFGALIGGILMAQRGFDCVYLGPSVPFDDIAHAAESTNAELIVLSINSIMDDEHQKVIEDGIAQLSKITTVWVGGPGGITAQLDLTPPHRSIASLIDFDRALSLVRL
ncbi:MAG: MerR family transcriptional regulator [Myxococcota bacterium]|nr:MerR family transcriptional regulator [Myxococcota bacterium]